ncbi:MAG: tRNA (N6-isopentenyl adenosine(37)-C2)-methylthiotransferase MiaB [Phascolarctobacterium sp.]|nr:tRNA (N6-isopentenyl adenosine(37)-C2)-methylthiotransferase MiaB [Phascolarctobacterium sp.]
MKYFMLNYGCQMNESDTEHYAGQLVEMGYTAEDDFHHADIIIINTCCVRESAEKRISGKIGKLKAVKAKNPDLVICVAGCMAQKDGEKLLKKHPQIDIILGTAYVNSFKSILTNYLKERRGAAYTDLTLHQGEFEGKMVRKSTFSAWIPIMYGCNNFCSYCIVPYVRGRERSRGEENILSEIKAAVKKGYSEFTLLGQNVNSYGKDTGSGAFSNLLRKADAIEGVERIRYMTSHPRDMGEDVVRAVAECGKVCENFHLPFQAGSNEILRRMNRGYTREKYLELVAMIREIVPSAAITTDIIVGFPGEAEKDFLDTLDLMKKVGFDAAFTFAYSRRSGTPAAVMEGQVPPDIKKARLHELMAVQNEESLKRNKMLIGQTVEVLAEGPGRKDDMWCGRTRTNKLVFWPVKDKKYAPGMRVSVKVEKAQTWLVKGTAVESG